MITSTTHTEPTHSKAPATSSQNHPTLEAEEARQATRGNGVWMVLTVSTGLAITVLLILFGGAMS